MSKWLGSKRDFLNRICALEQKVAETNRCKKIDADLDEALKTIQEYLPEDKKHTLVTNVEDCFTHLLILHEELFYKYGCSDAICDLYGMKQKVFRKSPKSKNSFECKDLKKNDFAHHPALSADA